MATTSTTSVYLSQINEFFPVAGKDNDTQVFRNNFSNIKEALRYADKDIETLKLITVKTTGTVNFNYNLVKKAVFQDCATYINDNALGSSSGGDITVNYKDGSYQKYAVDGGTHLFTVDPTSWPGSASFPVQGNLILYITTSTSENTYVIFPGDYIQQGPNLPPFQINNSGPQIFNIWNDGISTFVKPISNYKNVISNDTLESDFLNVNNTLKIRDNYYTTGTNQETVIYNTLTEQIGNLAILPNEVTSTFGNGGGDYPGDSTATQFTIEGNTELIKIGAVVYTPGVTSLNTASCSVTNINGNLITVSPYFSVPGGWDVGDTIKFVNPRFSDQPDILRLSNKTITSVDSIVGDVAGEVAATTTTIYITVADHTPDTINKVKLLTDAGISEVLPTGIITLWYGTVSNIPVGWTLCNGSNGTPDLRDKFVIGANQDDSGVAKTNITGSLTQTGGTKDAVVVSHTHAITDPGHSHDIDHEISSGNVGADLAGGIGSGQTSTSEIATTGITADSTGTSGTNQNLPPYYALCYIMKL